MARLTIRYLLEKQLADGSIAYYYNAPAQSLKAGILKSCSLGKDKALAVATAETYNKLYDEWKAGDEAIGKLSGSIGWLIEQYQASGWYKKLKPKTKKGYDADLKRIDSFKLKSGKTLGGYLAGVISPTMADAIYLELQALNEHDTPTKLRTANGVMVMAHRLWNFGIRYHGIAQGIHENPFHKMGLMKVDARSERWTMAQVEQFVKKADEMDAASIGTAALICYMFNQRVTTAITAPWSGWDGTALLVQQSKRGRVVWVPALPELRDRLNALRLKGISAVQIVIDERTSRPYNEYSFSHRGQEIRKAAGIPTHLQIRDLRRTGTTETRDAGANVHELQATTGNNLESLQIYSIPSNEEAASAMRKREDHRTKLRQKSE